MGSSHYVILDGFYRDLMHFSDWQWLLFTVFRKSQPPLLILLFNSIFALSETHCLSPQPLASFCVFFPMRDECRLQYRLRRRTNCFVYASDLWAEAS